MCHKDKLDQTKRSIEGNFSRIPNVVLCITIVELLASWSVQI